MSVDYRAINFYGVRFETKADIEDWLDQIKVAIDDVYEGLADIITLNEIDDTDYLLGFKVKLGEPESTYQAAWRAAFPNSDRLAEFITEVQVS